jgi:hypothetical protein
VNPFPAGFSHHDWFRSLACSESGTFKLRGALIWRFREDSATLRWTLGGVVVLL